MDSKSPESRASPRIPKQQIPEGPIQEFIQVIDALPPEEWKKRTSSLQQLVAAIPEEITETDIWYASPPTLRHLTQSLSELLKDPRSSVVKLSCQSLNELFSKCGSIARYLFKDLMPTVCKVQGSTIKVIRNYVHEMTLQTIPKIQCKIAIPIWLDRLKNDKSKTVREACAMYLYTALASWGTPKENASENETNSGYLSKEIYLQVGTLLVKSLRDPSPLVRQNCKKGVEVLASQSKDTLDEIIADDSLKLDSRVMKVLLRLQAGETGLGDDVSVASRISTRSRGMRSVASAPMTRSRALRNAIPPRGGKRPLSGKVPVTIGVSTPPRPKSKTKNKKSPKASKSSKSKSKSKTGLSAPPRRVATTKTELPKEPATPKDPIASSDAPTPKDPITPSDLAFSTPTQKLLETTPTHPSPVTPLEYEIEQQDNGVVDLTPKNESFDSNDSVLFPIANAEELRLKAKSRTMLGTHTSRRSSLLQDRLLRSTSKLEPETPRDSFPIHTKIAYELLEAHKVHVDHVMETLKVEMDALKDFEFILLEQAPVRPTEEEVIEYFESLGLCLEQRKKAGTILQKRMDKISQGE